VNWPLFGRCERNARTGAVLASSGTELPPV
jgi:hypothetical protein